MTTTKYRALARLEITAAEKGQEWWDNLDKQEQKDYLKKHPNSKYAKKAGSTKQSKEPEKKKTPKKTDDSSKVLIAKEKALEKEIDTWTKKVDRLNVNIKAFHERVGEKKDTKGKGDPKTAKKALKDAEKKLDSLQKELDGVQSKIARMTR